MPSKRLILLPALIILGLTSSLTAGCSGSTPASTDHTPAMAPMEQMPAEVQSAPVSVQQAYQFAVANPDMLQHIPCYCGCGKMGHTSNYACYVSGTESTGAVKFDTHALGCSICVDITQDTMRLLGKGQNIEAIRTYVDNTYSQYGPSNMP